MRILWFSLAAALLLGLGLLWLLNEQRTALERPIAIAQDEPALVLVPGTTLGQVARELQRRGHLDEPRYLVWYARWHGLAARIKAGEYALRPGTNLLELLDDLVAGRVVQHALTIVEGWTFRQVMQAVNAHPRLEHTLVEMTDEQVMQAIGRPDEHPEGRFFPDTYLFPSRTTDREFLRRAHASMERRLQEAWEGRDEELPYANPYEALIMASIVERETGEPSERPRIAGVFVRRLDKRMRLETDPTVIYGMGERFDGNLRRRDLREDTPYNTYVHRGLPPTPIAMPGAAALHAAVHPADGNELFFVARGDGSHVFSATLEEHNKAVAEYQLRRRSKPAPAAGRAR